MHARQEVHAKRRAIHVARRSVARKELVPKTLRLQAGLLLRAQYRLVQRTRGR